MQTIKDKRMTEKIRHVAVIPAREGSVGFPKKNQKFFDITADFLNHLLWFDEIIVTSNDRVILDKAKIRKYTPYRRSESLSGPDISIKSVMEDLVKSLKIQDNVIIWLFYLPIPYKNYSDFDHAKHLIETLQFKSLCSFVPAKSHPFNTWKYDQKNKKINQFIKNDIYRRQDLPLAWMHHHYLCCFRVKELKNLNNELLNSKTYPIFLSKKHSENLVEIDTYEDLEKWQEANSK
tara:strand:- start:35619 stop:36320 length:702 start_codon:yes stop_codon:yes gene_type:complete